MLFCGQKSLFALDLGLWAGLDHFGLAYFVRPFVILKDVLGMFGDCFRE